LYDPRLIYPFLCIFQVSSGQDKVEQSSREMSASDGDQVILRCNYTTTDTSPYLFWYTQLPNRSPTFILNKYTFGGGTTEDEFKERFSATLDSTSRSVPLTIQDVSVSDSAVYYCALQPTVTQTHSTLIQKHEIDNNVCSKHVTGSAFMSCGESGIQILILTLKYSHFKNNKTGSMTKNKIRFKSPLSNL